jgi:hypothetical protein
MCISVVLLRNIAGYEAIKEFLHLIHFSQIFCYLLFIVSVLLSYMFLRQLLVSSNQQSVDARTFC